MSAHHTLLHTLRDILHAVNPTEDDRNRCLQIINHIREIVESMEILRGATVEPLGSFVSNLFASWGDLDISIELYNGVYISIVGKNYKQSLLEDIQQALKIDGRFRRIRFASQAKVPILKCDDKKLNISCDISINNLSGQMKSKMLLWINKIDGRFRDMVLLVKEWAKAHGINDPKAGSLSSYSLSLLVIFHFQTCEPPILPPLSKIYPGNMVDELKGVRADAEQKIEKVCLENIYRITSDKSRTINRSSLAEHFLSFLATFQDLDLRAAEQGISPYNGQWEYIEVNMIWQPKTYELFIEDPFDQPINCARNISSRKLHKIAEAFRNSLEKLTSAYETHLIAILVRPKVLSMMYIYPGLRFSNIGMDGPRNHPQFCRNHTHNDRGLLETYPQPYENTDSNDEESQVHRTGHAPPQLIHQYEFQSDPTNGFDQQPWQASQSQVQRVQSTPINEVNQKPQQPSQNRGQWVQRDPNNGVNHRPGQAQGQVQWVQSNPNNGVDQKPEQVSQSQVKGINSDPNNGVNRRPGQASQSQVQWVQSNPNNGVNRKPEQVSQSQVKGVQRGPNNGVNHRPGQASQSQGNWVQSHPNNGVNQKPERVPQSELQKSQRTHNNGVNHKPGRESKNQFQQFQSNPDNGVNPTLWHASPNQVHKVQGTASNGDNQKHSQGQIQKFQNHGVNQDPGQASETQVRKFQNNRVNQKPGLASQSQVQQVQSNLNKGVNHKPGKASISQVQWVQINPNNGFNHKPGQASQVQSYPDNGVDHKPRKASLSRVRWVQSNRNNGVSHISGQLSQSQDQEVQSNSNNTIL